MMSIRVYFFFGSPDRQRLSGSRHVLPQTKRVKGKSRDLWNSYQFAADSMYSTATTHRVKTSFLIAKFQDKPSTLQLLDLSPRTHIHCSAAHAFRIVILPRVSYHEELPDMLPPPRSHRRRCTCLCACVCVCAYVCPWVCVLMYVPISVKYIWDVQRCTLH